MMEKILEFLKSKFSAPTYGDYLEQFIINKHPKVPADIELFERQWINKQTQSNGGQWL